MLVGPRNVLGFKSSYRLITASTFLILRNFTLIFFFVLRIFFLVIELIRSLHIVPPKIGDCTGMVLYLEIFFWFCFSLELWSKSKNFRFLWVLQITRNFRSLLESVKNTRVTNRAVSRQNNSDQRWQWCYRHSFQVPENGKTHGRGDRRLRFDIRRSPVRSGGVRQKGLQTVRMCGQLRRDQV